MHIPGKFKETDVKSLYKLIESYPLGALVVSTDNNLDASHLPFCLSNQDSGAIVLQSHIARANALWKNCGDGQQVLLIFNGPNAYISPNFYPSKHVDGKAVPTWNYSVVHVKGRVYFKHDRDWIYDLIKRISDIHEAKLKGESWSVSDAPKAYIEKMINAVVGVEVEIDSVVGNFKLSQNKTAEDYSGVLNSLIDSDDKNAWAMHQYMICMNKNG